MKNAEIRELTTDEIKELIQEQKEKLWHMKMAHTVSPIEHSHKLKETKKFIARLLTELRARELNENPNLRKKKKNKRKK